MINESWIELQSQAFAHNIALYKNIIGPRSLALVLKCNAYGHGLLPIAHLAQQNNHIQWLCVARLHEALQLRTHGIKKPILLLSPLLGSYEEAIMHEVDLMVHNVECINAIFHAAKRCNTRARVHIKVDTGLSRFGAISSQALELIEFIHANPFLQLVGIYTHFSDADNLEPSYTHLQQERFYSFVHDLKMKKKDIEYIHCANTAFASTGNLGPTNLVRIGAGAYGMWPSDAVEKITKSIDPNFTLQQIVSWKTSIVRLTKVDPGTPIGYSKTAIAKKVTIIGFIPVGYYDGYDRRLSNKGYVYINGKKAPVIGRVGMNITAIDVTTIANVAVGTQVELLGDKPGITFDAIAKMTKSYNPREFASKINSEIPRVVVPCEAENTITKRKKQDHVYY